MDKLKNFWWIILLGVIASCDLTDPIAGTEYDDLYYAESDIIQQPKLKASNEIPSSSPFDASNSSTTGSADYLEDYYDSSYIANLNRRYGQDLTYQYSDPREENPSLWNPSTQLGVSMGTAMGYGFSSVGVQTGFGSPYYDPYYGYNTAYSPWNPYGFNSNPYYAWGYHPNQLGMGYYYARPIHHVPVYRPNVVRQDQQRSYASNPRDHKKENPNQYSSPRQQQPINRSAKNWDTRPTYNQPSRNYSEPSYSSPSRSSSTYSSPSRSSSPSRGSSSPRSVRSGGGSPR